MSDTSPALPTAPPDADRLGRLDDDLWRGVLVHLRRSLREVAEAHGDPQARRLASVPASRLVSGRARRDVGAMLAGGGQLWLDLRRRLAGDPDLAARFGEALTSAPPPAPAPAPRPSGPDPAELQQSRERLRRMRDQRDDARRRAEGEAARAEREAAARVAAEQTVDELQRRVDALEEALARATSERQAAVERERRRGEAALADAADRLRELRREQQEQARRQQAASQARAAQEATPRPRARPTRTPRLVPGRPSRLPAGVEPGTTEAAQALLHAGRLVLVDGYNVTRTHRDDLDLEAQRRWLVNLVGGGAAARRIEPTVVFDGHTSHGPGSSRRERGVTVVFTPEGVTADDDLVFEVEALDPDRPVVVVTDDRELRDRLSRYGVDLLSTRGLVDALR